MNANYADLGTTPTSEASHLGLHYLYLPMSAFRMGKLSSIELKCLNIEPAGRGFRSVVHISDELNWNMPPP